MVKTKVKAFKLKLCSCGAEISEIEIKATSAVTVAAYLPGLKPTPERGTIIERVCVVCQRVERTFKAL